MIPPFKWLYTFIDTPEEWHAFVEGVSEGITLGRLKHEPSNGLKKSLRSEHHYYAAGAGIGIIMLIFSIAGAVAIVIGAI